MIAQWMQAFVAVAESDSFSSAARRLGVGQSTISKQIAALEAHLAIRLFQRTTRSITLTNEGVAYFEAAKRALAAIDEARAAASPKAEAQGMLRITLPLTLAESRIIPIIADFLAAHPRIEIDLSVSDHPRNLVADNIDVAIRVGRMVDSQLIGRKIGKAKRVLVASPDYLAHAGRPNVPGDLKNHNCLQYSLLSTGTRWQFTDGQVVQVNGNFSADSPNALRAAALSGIGIAANALWLFEDDLLRGGLELVLPNFEPASMPIHAVFPSGQFVAARTRTFIDFVANALATDPLCAPD